MPRGVHNPELKEEAIKLRLQDRLSYNEIHAKLGVPKGTLSYWLSSYPLTDEEVQAKIDQGVAKSAELTKKHRVEKIAEWRAYAEHMFTELKNEPFFLLGVGIYWGEGHKRNETLCVSNSDFNLLKVWVTWHRRYIPNAELRGKVSAHLDVDEEKAVAHWSQLDIGQIQLYRSVPKSSQSKRPPNRLPYGTLQVITCDGSLEWYTKMMKWIEMTGSCHLL